MRKESIPVLTAYVIGDQTADIDVILKAVYEDIGEAAERIPPWLGWFGYQKAKAAERIINHKYHLKEAEAKEYFALKGGEFVSKGFGEKMTETALERAVVLSPEVKQATKVYAQAEKDYEWLKHTIEALSAKLELIRSSEATRRAESECDRTKGTTV
jgi:hypothetical protein